MFVSRASSALRSLSNLNCRTLSSSAVSYERHGAPSSVLKLSSSKVGASEKVSADQVLVRMLAAPVSPSDLHSVAGLVPNVSSSGICGSEGVGEVEAVGSNVKALKKGDRVVPTAAGLGTWSNYTVANESGLIAVPKEVSVEQAALLGSAPATALRVVSDIVALGKGDTVVVNGANSPVGMAVVQVCKAKGIKVVSVLNAGVSDFSKVSEALKAIGSEVVVDEGSASSSAFRKTCADAQPKLAVHCSPSAEAASSIARVLAPGGTLVSVSGAGPVTLASSLLIDRGIKVEGFNLQSALSEKGEETFGELLQLVEGGAIEQIVAAKEPLSNFSAAVEKASSNPNGNVLLTM